MGIGRASKIAAGIIFVVAALGVATPVLLVPLGLASGCSAKPSERPKMPRDEQTREESPWLRQQPSRPTISNSRAD